jgi:hypothetical protein
LLNSSKDCINWNMLTPPSDEAKDLAQMCQGRFSGDPSHDFEVTKYNTTNEDTEEENIEEYKVMFLILIERFVKINMYLVIIT